MWLAQGLMSGSSFYVGTSLSDEIRVGDQWMHTGVPSLEGTGWHHYAVVRGPTDTFLYVDGSLAANAEYAIPNPPDAAFVLARQFGGYEEFLSGSIDEVAIYDRALSAGEIASLSAVPEPIRVGPFRLSSYC